MEEDLLAATGTLRGAYAGVDWAATGLGDPAGWDDLLVSTLRLALGTRFPVCLFWGQDLVMVYNEAYTVMIEDKHPGALGRGVQEVLPEAWPVIGPTFATARGGTPTFTQDQRLLLRRHGDWAEETFFTYAYSPVTDAAGQVAGVMAIAVETTTQIVDRRRLEVLAALNLALADLLDPGELADPVLAVLRSATADLPAVDLLHPDDGPFAAGTRDTPVDPRLPTIPPDLGAETFLVQDTPAGPVAWVRLSATRAGTRRPVLVVLLNPHAALDGPYRAFLELLAASVAAALDRAQVHAVEQAASGVTRAMSEALQRSMLTELPQPDHLQLHARYQPAADTEQVGGDWYDAVVMPDGATTLVIGDVVGHDSRAAAAMGQLRAMTRTLAWAFEEPPTEVVSRVDRAMAELHISTLATVVLGRIEQTPADRATGMRRLRWTSAGHLPPLLIHAEGSAEYLPGRSDLLLGIDPDAPRRDHLAVLPPGSTLLLFTDGLVERRRQTLTTTLELLRTTAAAHAHLELTDLVETLITQMTGEHRGQHDGHDDDLAVLAVRLHPEDAPRPPEAGPGHL